MLEDKHALDHVLHEDALLEELGYQPELKRSFGLLGMLGFSFSIVTSWSALGGVLIIGVQSGGPPVMIYSWIAVCILCLAVAYSMAELCSAYPVAGGQYSWVAVLAPPKIARGMSWITGWFMITGDALSSYRQGALLICNYRCSRDGSDQQLHYSKLHSWPSESIVSWLYNRALAHSPSRLLGDIDLHRYQYLRPTLTRWHITWPSILEHHVASRYRRCHSGK